MTGSIVITGIGMVTPLGSEPAQVLRRLLEGDTAISAPDSFDAAPFDCHVCATVRDFDPTPFVSEPKMIRLMNRDAQLAVVAARRALAQAGVRVGTDYARDEIGIFGAAGMAGLALGEVAPLLRASVTPDGRFDLNRFGQAGRRAVSPTLSFKILPNMPVCFVAINEGIQGPNAIYAPWEGHGAQAIEAGIRSLRSGDARCAIVGACDVKCHALAFASLSQLGVFDSWRSAASGVAPGEGAAFLVLETEPAALKRGAAIVARLAASGLRTRTGGASRVCVFTDTIECCLNPDAADSLSGSVHSPVVGARQPERGLQAASTCNQQMASGDFRNCGAAQSRHVPPMTGRCTVGGLVSAANGNPSLLDDENAALAALRLQPPVILRPKTQTGDLFAAAGLLQVAVGAMLARQLGGRVLADCFGHGSGQATFLLEAP